MLHVYFLIFELIFFVYSVTSEFSSSSIIDTISFTDLKGLKKQSEEGVRMGFTGMYLKFF